MALGTRYPSRIYWYMELGICCYNLSIGFGMYIHTLLAELILSGCIDVTIGSRRWSLPSGNDSLRPNLRKFPKFLRRSFSSTDTMPMGMVITSNPPRTPYPVILLIEREHQLASLRFILHVPWHLAYKHCISCLLVPQVASVSNSYLYRTVPIAQTSILDHTLEHCTRK